jgi:hypothetical protein
MQPEQVSRHQAARLVEARKSAAGADPSDHFRPVRWKGPSKWPFWYLTAVVGLSAVILAASLFGRYRSDTDPVTADARPAIAAPREAESTAVDVEAACWFASFLDDVSPDGLSSFQSAGLPCHL